MLINQQIKESAKKINRIGKLDILNCKAEMHTFLSQMELSDTPNEDQSKIESTFRTVSHIFYQHLLSISKVESKDHFINESNKRI